MVEAGGEEPRRPLWNIVVVAAIAAGIQFGWALQLSLLTPYVQTLGVPHAWASFIWLCGPISGLVVQPMVGYSSDHCTSRFGRRRPFIVAGACFVTMAVFFIGFAKDIGHQAGDSLDQHMKPRAVAIFVTGFWILDVANNMLQGPCRAFLADLSGDDHKRMRIANGWFSFFMAIGNVAGYAAGSYADLHKLLPFTQTTACADVYCANLKTLFIIDIVFLVAITTIACASVKETPLSIKEVADKAEGGSSRPFFVELVSSFKTLKKPMWILLSVTSLNWIAWFPFVLYDTDWMAKEVYGGNAKGTAGEMKLYDSGVRAGALGLMINSIVLAFTSLGLEPASKLLGGVKNLWGLVNIILAAGLASTVWITKMVKAWRAQNGSPMSPPPTNVISSTLALFGVLGIPLAVTYSIPFALASMYCSDVGGGQGLSLGVLNMSIVIPQMIISVIIGPLDAAFGGGNLPGFVMAAIVAAISALVAFCALPKTKSHEPLNTAGGGGH